MPDNVPFVGRKYLSNDGKGPYVAVVTAMAHGNVSLEFGRGDKPGRAHTTQPLDWFSSPSCGWRAADTLEPDEDFNEWRVNTVHAIVGFDGSAEMFEAIAAAINAAWLKGFSVAHPDAARDLHATLTGTGTKP